MLRKVKLGVLIPPMNFVVEPDMYAMAPEGVTVHFERLEEGSIKVGGVLTAENISANSKILETQLEELTGDVLRGAKKISIIKPDIIAFGCTSGSFFKGIAYDKAMIRKTQEVVGIPVITTSTAAVEALRELGLKRICVIAPYGEWALNRLNDFLRANGFEVVASQGMDLGPVESDYIQPEDIYRLATETWKDCDGIFCGCTGFRAAETIEKVESHLGKPMASANQATMWLMLKTIGVKKAANGFGKLMKHL